MGFSPCGNMTGNSQNPITSKPPRPAPVRPVSQTATTTLRGHMTLPCKTNPMLIWIIQSQPIPRRPCPPCALSRRPNHAKQTQSCPRRRPGILAPTERPKVRLRRKPNFNLGNPFTHAPNRAKTVQFLHKKGQNQPIQSCKLRKTKPILQRLLAPQGRFLSAVTTCAPAPAGYKTNPMPESKTRFGGVRPWRIKMGNLTSSPTPSHPRTLARHTEHQLKKQTQSTPFHERLGVVPSEQSKSKNLPSDHGQPCKTNPIPAPHQTAHHFSSTPNHCGHSTYKITQIFPLTKMNYCLSSIVHYMSN